MPTLNLSSMCNMSDGDWGVVMLVLRLTGSIATCPAWVAFLTVVAEKSTRTQHQTTDLQRPTQDATNATRILPCLRHMFCIRKCAATQEHRKVTGRRPPGLYIQTLTVGVVRRIPASGKLSLEVIQKLLACPVFVKTVHSMRWQHHPAIYSIVRRL